MLVKREGRRLYSEPVRTNKKPRMGDPVCLTAVTNHRGTRVDGSLERGYRLAAIITRQPLPGYWLHDTKGPYLDAVTAKWLISRAGAIEFGREHGQESTLGIEKDGSWERIDID